MLERANNWPTYQSGVNAHQVKS